MEFDVHEQWPAATGQVIMLSALTCKTISF